MSFTVNLTSAARRDLHKVPPRILPAVIEFMDGDLSRDPFRVGKPLKGEFVGLWSARRGTYRIVHHINARTEEVTVRRVDHRADVHRPS